MEIASRCSHVPAGLLTQERIEEELACFKDDEIATIPIGDVLPSLKGWRSGPAIAYHEAGHAVVAAYMGFPVHSLHVDGALTRGVMYSHPPPVGRNPLSFREAEIKRSFHESPEPSGWYGPNCSFAAMHLAGYLAELRFYGAETPPLTLCTGKYTDYVAARWWAGNTRSEAVMLVCQRLALQVLDQRWDAVKAVAERLSTRLSVDKEELNHLLGE